MEKLSGLDIENCLAVLNSATKKPWQVLDGKLHKEYRFGDFISAFGFMAQAALWVEKLNHHPEWFNVYNKVRVDLVTHEAGGISAKDFELAEKLDTLAATRDSSGPRT